MFLLFYKMLICRARAVSQNTLAKISAWRNYFSHFGTFLTETFLHFFISKSEKQYRIIDYVDHHPPPPVGWGATYCFTAVGVRVTPITMGPPCSNFFWVTFFVPQVIGFWFLLWPWHLGSGSSFESVFCCYEFFSLFYQKYVGDFDQTWQETS